MRTPSRLAVATAVLGGGLLLAGPAAAQGVDCDEYPELDECVITGEIDSPASAENSAGSPSGGATSLPFTGGEVTMIALAGSAALGGGIALAAAGRKRKTV